MVGMPLNKDSKPKHLIDLPRLYWFNQSLELWIIYKVNNFNLPNKSPWVTMI